MVSVDTEPRCPQVSIVFARDQYNMVGTQTTLRPGILEVLPETTFRKAQRQYHLGQKGVVFGKVLVTVGVLGDQTWVVDGKLLGGGLAVSVVGGVTVDDEVGRLMDECPSSGIGTGIFGLPEGTAGVGNSEFFGI